MNAFENAGYSFEYPGYWDKQFSGCWATISADAPYTVQILSDDGAECLAAGEDDCATAEEAIALAQKLVNDISKKGS